MENEVRLVIKEEEAAIKLGVDINAFKITYAMIKEAEIGTRWTRERTSSLGFSTPTYKATVIDKDANEATVKVVTIDESKTSTELYLITFL